MIGWFGHSFFALSPTRGKRKIPSPSRNRKQIKVKKKITDILIGWRPVCKERAGCGRSPLKYFSVGMEWLIYWLILLQADKWERELFRLVTNTRLKKNSKSIEESKRDHYVSRCLTVPRSYKDSVWRAKPCITFRQRNWSKTGLLTSQ